VRTVKGCLSAIVFKREGESQWSINESKVQEFVRQANEKLTMFFEKLKRNFPKFEEIRNYQQCRKMKKKRREESIEKSLSLRPMISS
jgi:beta-1,4-N-acetylglucosaminyltransferase